MTKDEYKDKNSWYEKDIENIKKALKTTEENYAKDTKKIEAKFVIACKELADKVKESVQVAKDMQDSKTEHDALKTENASLAGKNAVLDAQLGLKDEAYHERIADLKKDLKDLDDKKRAFLKMMADKHTELDAKKSSMEYAEGKNKGVLRAIVAEKEGIQTLIKRFDEEKLDFSEKQHQFAIEKKTHSDKMQKDNSTISRLESWEKGLANKNKAGQDKVEALDKREKAITATEQAQKDKGVEQDLREVEQGKTQRRIENLIQMNKLKNE